MAVVITITTTDGVSLKQVADRFEKNGLIRRPWIADVEYRDVGTKADRLEIESRQRARRGA